MIPIAVGLIDYQVLVQSSVAQMMFKRLTKIVLYQVTLK